MNRCSVSQRARLLCRAGVWLFLLVLLALPLPTAAAAQDSGVSISLVPALEGSSCSGDGVYLYAKINYKGRCLKWMASDRKLADNGFDDEAASIRFVGSYGGGRYAAILYEHPAEKGAWSAFGADDPDLGNDRIGRDSASSIRIKTVPPCTGDGVYLYESKNYAGRCYKFTASDADLADTGFDDVASSIKFVGSYGGGLYKVKLCDDAGYQGTCSVFTVNDPGFGDEVIGHDRTSSVLVEKVKPKFCVPTSGTISQRFDAVHALTIAGSKPAGVTRVYAAHAGTVVYVGSTRAGCSRAYAVAIRYDNLINGKRILTLYSGMGHWTGTKFVSYVRVAVGDRVTKGQLIGYQGDAPAGVCGAGASGVDLEFGVYEKDKPFRDAYTSWGKRCDHSDLFFELGGTTGSCSLNHTARAANPEAPRFLGVLGASVTQSCSQ